MCFTGLKFLIVTWAYFEFSFVDGEVEYIVKHAIRTTPIIVFRKKPNNSTGVMYEIYEV